MRSQIFITKKLLFKKLPIDGPGIHTMKLIYANKAKNKMNTDSIFHTSSILSLLDEELMLNLFYKQRESAKRTFQKLRTAKLLKTCARSTCRDTEAYQMLRRNGCFTKSLI